MPTWNQYAPGNPETLFSDIVQRPGQHVFQDTGSEDTSFQWGDGTFSVSGIYLQLTGTGFGGHYEDDEYISDYSGTVTGLKVISSDGYPVVEITGMSMQTLAVFDNIINGGADGLRNFINSQAWTYNGSAGDDAIEAGNKADTVIAHSGNDVVHGYGGADDIYGGSGNDTLSGGDGKDIIDGGPGTDKLSGGNGKDTFVFASHDGADTIRDFVNGIDRIDISDWKAIKDFDDIKADMTRDGEDVVITAGNDSLRISHIVKADIDVHDFIF